MIRRTSVIALALTIGAALPARALDLPTALGQVQSSNPSLVARAAMVDAAAARVGPAGAWSAPMLELGVVNLPTSSWAFDRDEMTMKMIGIEQRVPVSGANRRKRASARENVNAALADLSNERYERLGAAWEAYADAYYAGELARTTEHHRSVMERVVASARVRYQSGGGRLDDVLRAESERATSLADAAAYQGDERVARLRLDALRGITPGTDETNEPLAAPPLASVGLSPDPWLAGVGDAHPRLAAAEARTRAYQKAAQGARRSVWPDLDLKLSYGMRGTVMGTALDNMVSASVGLMLPIGSGAREGAEASEMEAMARASDAEHRQATLELRESVEAAYAIARATERRVSVLADTVLVAGEKAVDAAWSGYQAGTQDLWRVLEAAHSVYEQEIALTLARQSLARSEARLVALTGRMDLLGVRPVGSARDEKGNGR